MNLIFLCFDICNYICHETSYHFSVLPSKIFFIFSSTLVLTFSYRRSLYTFYHKLYVIIASCYIFNGVLVKPQLIYALDEQLHHTYNDGCCNLSMPQTKLNLSCCYKGSQLSRINSIWIHRYLLVTLNKKNYGGNLASKPQVCVISILIACFAVLIRIPQPR